MAKSKQEHQLGRIPTILLGAFLLLVLVGVNYLIELISADRVLDWREYLERALLIVNTIVISWVAIRFLRVVVWRPYEAKHKRPAPKSLVDLGNVGVILVAAAYVTTAVFGLPVWSILTAGGLVGAGVAVALQKPILDFFSGVMLDLEKPYKIGDWLELPSDATGKGGIVARVVAKNWRTTTFEDPFLVYIVVPNSILAEKGFLNFTRPEPHYMDSIIISLDHELPIDRGERILRAAALSVPEVAEYPDNCDAYSIITNSGGVDYCLRYVINEMANFRKIRHKVQCAVTSQLQEYNLRISETIGVYGLTRFGPLIKEPELTFTDAAQKVDLFQALSAEELAVLAGKIKPQVFKKGQPIVKEGASGDSNVIIGEGMADVYKKTTSKGKSTRQHLAFLGAGAFFGDMALLLGEKRSATVAGETDMIIFEISKAAITPILKGRPQIAQVLSEIVADRQLSTQTIMVKHAKDLAKKKADLSKKLLGGIKSFFGI